MRTLCARCKGVPKLWNYSLRRFGDKWLCDRCAWELAAAWADIHREKEEV